MNEHTPDLIKRHEVNRISRVLLDDAELSQGDHLIEGPAPRDEQPGVFDSLAARLDAMPVSGWLFLLISMFVAGCVVGKGMGI